MVIDMVETKVISEEEMNTKRTDIRRERRRNELDPSSEEYLNRTDTGRYEKINDERYEVHRDIGNERECTGDTTQTYKVVHMIDKERKNSFWLSLCSSHYEQMEDSEELEIVDAREPIGEG